MERSRRPLRELLAAKAIEVISVTPDASVLDALRLMAEKRVGAVLVLDSERLIGVLSERDYARKGELAGRMARQTSVRELMTADVIVVGPDHTIDQAMAIMTIRRIRHLPIIESGRVVGVVSIGDLVKDAISHLEAIADEYEHDRLFMRVEETGYY